MKKFKSGFCKSLISIFISVLMLCSVALVTASAYAADPVASVTGDSFSNLYYSIEAAWEDARVNPGCTISLLKNVTAVSDLELNFDNLDFTVDLNGKTLGMAGNSITVNTGNLTIMNNPSSGVGKVTGSTTPINVNGGELTINSGLFACTNGNNNSVVLNTTGGTVNINDGIFTDRINFLGTDVNINGGDFFKNVGYNCTDMTLVVSDGNFTAGLAAYNGTVYISGGDFEFLSAYSTESLNLSGGRFQGMGSYGAGYFNSWLSPGYAYYNSNGEQVSLDTGFARDCNVTVEPIK